MAQCWPKMNSTGHTEFISIRVLQTSSAYRPYKLYGRIPRTVRSRSLLVPIKEIPCVDLFRDITPTTDAIFDVCCNKTGDCQNTQDLSLNR